MASWRPPGSILEATGLHFRRFWAYFSEILALRAYSFGRFGHIRKLAASFLAPRTPRAPKNLAGQKLFPQKLEPWTLRTPKKPGKVKTLFTIGITHGNYTQKRVETITNLGTPLSLSQEIDACIFSLHSWVTQHYTTCKSSKWSLFTTFSFLLTTVQHEKLVSFAQNVFMAVYVRSHPPS